VITSELIEAYLACPLKCHLQSKGEKSAENSFAAWNDAQQESYRLASTKRLGEGVSNGLACDPLDAAQLLNGQWQLALDQKFAAERNEALKELWEMKGQLKAMNETVAAQTTEIGSLRDQVRQLTEHIHAK